MPGRRLILVLVMLLITLTVLSAGRDISRRGPAGQSQQTTIATQPAQSPREEKNGKESGDRSKDAGGVIETRRLPSSKPVQARLGERVLLRVKTARPDIIAIDQMGIRAPTGPGTSGTLDFVAGTEGNFPVILALGERRIGTVSVR